MNERNLLLANEIAKAIRRKYSLTTGYQFTEESVSDSALIMTIAEVLETHNERNERT